MLLIIGGLFVLEAVSVIVQVASFKLTGKRVFRMAPLASPFRAKGLGRADHRHPFLDHRRDFGTDRALDIEASLEERHDRHQRNDFADQYDGKIAAVLGLSRTGLSACRALVGGGGAGLGLG